MNTSTKASGDSESPIAATVCEETKSNPSPEELQNIQATYRLNGKNYLKWIGKNFFEKEK